jgi:hypothetical protein
LDKNMIYDNGMVWSMQYTQFSGIRVSYCWCCCPTLSGLNYRNIFTFEIHWITNVSDLY